MSIYSFRLRRQLQFLFKQNQSLIEMSLVRLGILSESASQWYLLRHNIADYAVLNPLKSICARV